MVAMAAIKSHTALVKMVFPGVYALVSLHRMTRLIALHLALIFAKIQLNLL